MSKSESVSPEALLEAFNSSCGGPEQANGLLNMVAEYIGQLTTDRVTQLVEDSITTGQQMWREVRPDELIADFQHDNLTSRLTVQQFGHKLGFELHRLVEANSKLAEVRNIHSGDRNAA